MVKLVHGRSRAERGGSKSMSYVDHLMHVKHSIKSSFHYSYIYNSFCFHGATAVSCSNPTLPRCLSWVFPANTSRGQWAQCPMPIPSGKWLTIRDALPEACRWECFWACWFVLSRGTNIWDTIRVKSLGNRVVFRQKKMLILARLLSD